MDNKLLEKAIYREIVPMRSLKSGNQRYKSKKTAFMTIPNSTYPCP